jgi:protocatechuate 3,4-dioxygenase beta subunit
VTTDAAGLFNFAALAAGSYRFIAGDDAHAPGAIGPVVVDGVHAVDNLRIELSAGAAIAGRVVRADGAPAAGAIVRIAPHENAFRPVPRQTAAGADGGFRMAGLPRQPVYLVAFGDDASSETIEVDLTATPERRDLVVKLGIEGVIAGMVVDAKGQPVEGAQVAAYPPLGDAALETARLRTAAVALTDGGGAFRLTGLPDGAYTLRAYRDAVPAGTDWIPTGTSARVGDTQVRVVLPGDGAVIGKVALPDGTPPPVAFVRLGTRPPMPVTEGSGAFRVARVSAGRTSLTVSGPSFETIVVHDVNVDADAETDVGTITVRKGRSIVGHVLTPDGKPVPGASVFCGKRVVGSGSNLTSQTWGPAGSSGATRTADTDETGYYAIRGMGPMEVVVIADHPTLGRSATVRVPASNETSTIDLVLASPGAIEGTVARGGQPLPHFQVTASPHPVTHNASFVVTTDDSGHYRFDRLVPGDYLVTATGGMHPIAGVTQTGSLVTVADSQTVRFDVDLPATTVDVVVTLRDQAAAPVRMAEVHVLPGAFAGDVAHVVHEAEAHLTGGFSAFNIVAEGRPARIRRVPPGDYTLCAVPYPAELRDLDPAEIAQFVDTQARNLPAYCRPLPVAAEPAEQPVAFDVRLPPLRH